MEQLSAPKVDSARRAKRPSEARRDPVAKAFVLLRWLVDDPAESHGVREISRALRFAPSTVHRILLVLVEQGLVCFDESVGRYSLGSEHFRMARKTTARLSLESIAPPILRQLTQATHETAFLAVYDAVRRQMMFAAVSDSLFELRHVLPAHQWLPLTPAASTLAIVAFLPEVERQLSTQEIQDRNAGSGSRPALQRQLDLIRKRGYAITVGTRNPDAVGVAAPVFDAVGDVIGAVGLTIPRARHVEANVAKVAAEIVRAARHLMTHFGGVAPENVRPTGNRTDV